MTAAAYASVPRVVPQKLFCQAFKREVDVFAPRDMLPACDETCREDGICDGRWCIWSLAVATALKTRVLSSGDDLWHLRDTIFFNPMRPIDWCESAWDPSSTALPAGSILVNFMQQDALTGNTHVLETLIDQAADESVKAGQLKFLELGTLDFPPDDREPCETPEIARWAQKCLADYADLLFWMGPVTIGWFLPCVRPTNWRKAERGIVLQLDESDLEEIIGSSRSKVLERLSNHSATDELISRLWSSSMHKLSWALTKGRPPVNYMPGCGRRGQDQPVASVGEPEATHDWNQIVLCPKCGAGNPANAAECIRCKTRLRPRREPSSDEPRALSKDETAAVVQGIRRLDVDMLRAMQSAPSGPVGRTTKSYRSDESTAFLYLYRHRRILIVTFLVVICLACVMFRGEIAVIILLALIAFFAVVSLGFIMRGLAEDTVAEVTAKEDEEQARREREKRQVRLDREAQRIADAIKKRVDSHSTLAYILQDIRTRDHEALAKAILRLDLKAEEKGRLFRNMNPDFVSDVLGYLPEAEQIAMLRKMEGQKRDDILMRFALSKRTRLKGAIETARQEVVFANKPNTAKPDDNTANAEHLSKRGESILYCIVGNGIEPDERLSRQLVVTYWLSSADRTDQREFLDDIRKQAEDASIRSFSLPLVSPEAWPNVIYQLVCAIENVHGIGLNEYMPFSKTDCSEFPDAVLIAMSDGTTKAKQDWANFVFAIAAIQARMSPSEILDEIVQRGCSATKAQVIRENVNLVFRSILTERQQAQICSQASPVIRCSDQNCPCSGDEPLQVGKTAYVFISDSLLEMRRDAITYLDLHRKLDKLTSRLSLDYTYFGAGSVDPMVLCERGAKLRNLDLKVALEDAALCLQDGFMPLRATPKLRGD